MTGADYAMLGFLIAIFVVSGWFALSRRSDSPSTISPLRPLHVPVAMMSRAEIYERNAVGEKLLSPSAMKIGVDHGMGCYADKLPEDERTQAIIPDQFRHEIATAFNLRGRGLIVLTS